MVDINTSIPTDCSYTQCRAVPTGILKDAVRDFVVKTDAFVQPLIGDALLATAIAPVHHYHHSSGWYPWYQPSRVVVVDTGNSTRSSSTSSKRSKEDKTLAIVATIAALVAIYTVGSSVARYNDARHELTEASDFQDLLEGAKDNPEETDRTLAFHAEKAAGLKERICRRMKNSALTDTVLRVSLLGGLIATAASAYVGNAAVLNTSLATNLVAGSLIMLKLGYDSFSNANARDAHSLRAQLIHLR